MFGHHTVNIHQEKEAESCDFMKYDFMKLLPAKKQLKP